VGKKKKEKGRFGLNHSCHQQEKRLKRNGHDEGGEKKKKGGRE